jgi:hypothetical protein
LQLLVERCVWSIVQIERIDFAAANNRVAEILKRPDIVHIRQPDCTLAAYAEAKRLPIDFLAGLGVRQGVGKYGRLVLSIPYRDRAGATLTTRFGSMAIQRWACPVPARLATSATRRCSPRCRLSMP